MDWGIAEVFNDPVVFMLAVVGMIVFVGFLKEAKYTATITAYTVFVYVGLEVESSMITMIVWIVITLLTLLAASGLYDMFMSNKTAGEAGVEQ